MVKDYSPHVYFFGKNKILTAIPQSMILQEAFEDFENIFLIMTANYLLPNKNYNCIFNFIANK